MYDKSTYGRICSELDGWNDYLIQTWPYFENEQESIQKWLLENYPTKPESDEEVMQVQTKFTKHSLLYPHRHLSAIFLKTYVIFESELDSFNYFYQMHRKIELSDKEEEKSAKNNDIIYKFKRLLLNQRIDIKDLDPEYNKLQNYKKLRDNLAHRKENTLISKPKDDVFRNFLQNTEGIIITESMWIQEGCHHTYFLNKPEVINGLRQTISEFYQKLFELTYGGK